MRFHRGAHFGLQFGDVFAGCLGEGSLETPDACRAEWRTSIARADSRGKICSLIALSEINDGRKKFSPVRAQTKIRPMMSGSGCGRRHRRRRWPAAARSRSEST